MKRANAAYFFRVMAFAWAFPSVELVSQLASGNMQGAVLESWQCLGNNIEPISDCLVGLERYYMQDEEEIASELKQEYSRLFLNPPAKIKNSEGVWLGSREGKNVPLIVNDGSLAVQRFMNSCGVARKKGYNDAYDYIDMECGFLSFLASTEQLPSSMEMNAEEAFDYFYKNHFGCWASLFCEEVLMLSDSAYYRAMASVLRQLFA